MLPFLVEQSHQPVGVTLVLLNAELAEGCMMGCIVGDFCYQEVVEYQQALLLWINYRGRPFWFFFSLCIFTNFFSINLLETRPQIRIFLDQPDHEGARVMRYLRFFRKSQRLCENFLKKLARYGCHIGFLAVDHLVQDDSHWPHIAFEGIIQFFLFLGDHDIGRYVVDAADERLSQAKTFLGWPQSYIAAAMDFYKAEIGYLEGLVMQK